ncbi:MAG: DUF1192 domain-containing protein [Proteobacteria bacterium]|nr:DUF1192 domain-containing protein [Pseudomonadota bacterium]
MIDEESGRTKKTLHAVGEDLAPLSVAELETRITILRGEITRLEGAIAGKRKTAAAADALFRGGAKGESDASS